MYESDSQDQGSVKKLTDIPRVRRGFKIKVALLCFFGKGNRAVRACKWPKQPIVSAAIWIESHIAPRELLPRSRALPQQARSRRFIASLAANTAPLPADYSGGLDTQEAALPRMDRMKSPTPCAELG
jgi:hypothetical protein